MTKREQHRSHCAGLIAVSDPAFIRSDTAHLNNGLPLPRSAKHPALIDFADSQLTPAKSVLHSICLLDLQTRL